MWVLVLLFVTVQPARAQTLSGTVPNPSGAPIPDASVIVSPQLGQSVVASTDRAGRFTVELRSNGTVVILVSHAGFADNHAERTIDAATTTSIEVRLSVSSFAEDLRVSADLSELPRPHRASD